METVTIVPGGEEGKYQTGYGTKVLSPDGKEIPGIRSIEISIRPDDVICAKLEMFVWFAEMAPIPGWYAHDPVSGEVRKIRAIIWDDDTTFNA